MPITIIHPFLGRAVGWTWQDHRAAGYLGGTDYKEGAGVPVIAAADGHLSYVGGIVREIHLTLDDNRVIVSTDISTTERGGML